MPAAPEAILDQIEATLEMLREAGERYDGLVPSQLDPETGKMLEETPENLPGQRTQDRADRGSNLLHDIQLVGTLYRFGELRDAPRFVAAADDYLETFTRECTGTPTGLFPWGEHAFWNLRTGEVGNGWTTKLDSTGPAIHDHLRHVPEWFWERMVDIDPACIHDYADGLTYQWNDPEKPEFNRHAYITLKDRYPIDDRSCDFPRHSGHFIYDWTFAYTQEQHPEYIRQINKTIDYWWERKELHHGGLLPLETRGNNESPSPSQTMSLTISLLDAASLLEDHELAPDLRERMETVATGYLDGYLSGAEATPEDRILSEPIWASIYGGAPPGATAASEALKLLCAYRHTGRESLLEWATVVGEQYAQSSFPEHGHVPIADTPFDSVHGLDGDRLPVWALAAGNGVGLLADLYDITGEDRWLDAGLELAEELMTVYWHDHLPRAAGGPVEHYESQLGSGYLIYHLARLGVLGRTGDGSTMPPTYTVR